MAVKHFLVFVILILTSCTQEIGNFHESSESVNNDSINLPYPSPPSSNSLVTDKNNNFWECGTDYIVTDNPDGTKSIFKVWMPCNPMADIYTGCPIKEVEILEK
jgi:hypothetical protein